MDCNCVFQRFADSLTEQQSIMFLQGACFVLSDKAFFYKELIAEECGIVSCSSHASDGLQYRCSTRGLNVLYGKLANRPGEVQTWIQLEAYSPFTRPIAHCCSWLNLVFTGRQTGPIGYSLHRAANPVYLNHRDILAMNFLRRPVSRA
jgi:hypothetical protein